MLPRLPTGIVALVGMFALTAANAHAAFYGSNLRRAPNLTFGCESALIMDSISGAPVIAPSGQRTCTFRSLGVLGRVGVTSFVPANGRIRSFSVRVGRNPARLRLTIMEGTGGGQLGDCCTAQKFGRTFRPRANAITRIPVNVKVENIVDTRIGLASSDVMAITAVGPGSLPLRATAAAGQFVNGAPLTQFWYPHTKVGEPRPEGYTMPGLELLFRWEFIPDRRRR